ncbi:Biogenesis of lysosome-related organelles complex 1 subunit KXD1 [Candida viswanathii]|uniref:Biogenesis of lysosome-related organelles complex 1 subunit KXD1 n=1 Tax=Candida viswanathii TaxID=5486 RepID=A0A367YF93_9ASCO|nr:Biogenesis of lysosome-related organelles complex 1 subunit KXD1 [Candida viswanathii]
MLDTTEDLAHVSEGAAPTEPAPLDNHNSQTDINESSSNENSQDFPNNNNNTTTATDLIHSPSDVEPDSEDDDYLLSDDEDLSRILSHDLDHARLPGSRNMAEHVKFFSSTLTQALDSVDIDKSLALEARISGNLNNENQKIIERKELLIEKLRSLQLLYGRNFGVSEESKVNRVLRMRNDIGDIERRIARLKNGTKAKSSIPFLKGKQNLGVVQKFPIEYNQAKDKVLERQFDGADYSNDVGGEGEDDDDEEEEDDLVF